MIFRILLLFLLLPQVTNAASFSAGGNFGFGKRIYLIHSFTGLPLTSDGWTDIKSLATTDSQIVYVSTSGDDSSAEIYTISSPEIGTDITNPSGTIKPYATLAAAYDAMRNGYPDILLLKRGDVWSEEFSRWRKSGKSSADRMVIGAYGQTSEPLPEILSISVDDGVGNNFLVISDLTFANTEEAPLDIGTAGNHILIEGCVIPEGPGTGVTIQNYANRQTTDYLAVRRCVIYRRYIPDSQYPNGYKQGIYIDDANNMLFEENIIDQNGWWETETNEASEDIKAHDVYIMLGDNGSENHIIRYNVVCRGRATGIIAGSGGTVYGNLLVQNAIGIYFGKNETWWYDGVSGTVEKNVILHGRDVNGIDERGWGIALGNVNGLIIEDNIIGDDTESLNPQGIWSKAAIRTGVMMYVRDVTIKNNVIHNWTGGLSSFSDTYGILFTSDDYDAAVTYNHGSSPDDYTKDIRLTNNAISLNSAYLSVVYSKDDGNIIESSDNDFYSIRDANYWFRLGYSGTYYNIDGYKSKYSDTTSESLQTSPSGNYGITDYLSSIGETATLDSFYTHLRAQRKGSWDTRYTAAPIINFVRDKFGKSEITTSY